MFGILKARSTKACIQGTVSQVSCLKHLRLLICVTALSRENYIFIYICIYILITNTTWHGNVLSLRLWHESFFLKTVSQKSLHITIHIYAYVVISKISANEILIRCYAYQKKIQFSK